MLQEPMDSVCPTRDSNQFTPNALSLGTNTGPLGSLAVACLRDKARDGLGVSPCAGVVILGGECSPDRAAFRRG
jgi:hypothetical protein